MAQDTEQKRRNRHVTQTGKAKYAWLTKPDTKFDKDNTGGDYKMTLVLEGPNGEALVAKLEKELESELAKLKAAHGERAKAAKAAGKKLYVFKAGSKPWSHDEESGEYEVKFKLPAQIEKKDGEIVKLHVALFDKQGVPLDKEVKIGNGSSVQVSYEIRPYDSPAFGAGISLRLLAVRVIELVEWGGGSADSFGFDTASDDEEVTENDDAPVSVGDGAAVEEETDF